MPLGAFESEILRLLAQNRNPDSFVAGATVLHQAADSLRLSKDIDLFHDTAESVLDAVIKDTATLRTHGYTVEIPHPQPTFQRGFVRKGDQQTKIFLIEHPTSNVQTDQVSSGPCLKFKV